MGEWKTNYLLLAEKLVIYITENEPVTLEQLEDRAKKHSIDLRVFDQAIAAIHRLQGIKQTTVNDTISYSVAVVKPPSPTPHLDWVRNNYPPMTEYNNGSGIDIDLGWMFLRTAEERDAYKAAATGRPVHMVTKTRKQTKKHGNTRRQNTVKNLQDLTPAQRTLLQTE